MTNRRLTVCAIGLVAASIAACASNVSGHGNDGSGPGAQQQAGTSGSASKPATLGPNTTASQLANALTSATTTIKSAHISLTAGVLGQSITGTGDEKLMNGKVRAFQITENLPGGVGSIAVVLVGTKVWIKLPAGLGGGTSSKPWHRVSSSSSDPTIRSVASSIDSTLSSASIAAGGKFIAAARSVKVVGKQTVNGVTATHVRMVVDLTKLSSALPGQSSASLQKLGLTSMPVDLYLDDQNRPVMTTTSLTAQGHTITSKVLIGRYNQPVTINPPPAGEIAPG